MRKTFIMLILITMVCIVSGCPATEPPATEPPDVQQWVDPKNPGELLSFHYSHGSFHEGYWFYDFTRTEDDEILFTAEGRNGIEMNVSTVVEQDVLDGIAAVIEEYDIYKWNSKGKEDSEHRGESVVDGWQFSLKAEFESGLLEAGVFGVAPSAGDGNKALQDHLWQLAESLK